MPQSESSASQHSVGSKCGFFFKMGVEGRSTECERLQMQSRGHLNKRLESGEREPRRGGGGEGKGGTQQGGTAPWTTRCPTGSTYGTLVSKTR